MAMKGMTSCSDDPIRVCQEEDEGKKPLILIYHDESTFHLSDGQSWLWAEIGKQPIQPKGQGREIMVNDFIDEYNGFLQLTNDEYDQSYSHHNGL